MSEGGTKVRKNQLYLENIVYEVLNRCPQTRDDDFELVLETYSTLCPSLLEMKFGSILKEHKEYGLPSFESITRARRKLQSNHRELVSEKSRKKRKQLENEYRYYYSNQEEWKEVDYE